MPAQKHSIYAHVKNPTQSLKNSTYRWHGDGSTIFQRQISPQGNSHGKQIFTRLHQLRSVRVKAENWLISRELNTRFSISEHNLQILAIAGTVTGISLMSSNIRGNVSAHTHTRIGAQPTCSTCRHGLNSVHSLSSLACAGSTSPLGAIRRRYGVRSILPLHSFPITTKVYKFDDNYRYKNLPRYVYNDY